MSFFTPFSNCNLSWIYQKQIWRSDDRASWYILVIKPTRCTNSQICFWNKTLHVLDSYSVHLQEIFTVHTAIVYVIQVCWQLVSRIRIFRLDPAHELSVKPVWHIPLLCVQWKSPEDGQNNCPKHVEFYSKNKFEN